MSSISEKQENKPATTEADSSAPKHALSVFKQGEPGPITADRTEKVVKPEIGDPDISTVPG